MIFTHLRRFTIFQAGRNHDDIEKAAIRKVQKLAASVDLDFAASGCFENAVKVMSTSDPTMENLQTALDSHSLLDSARGCGLNGKCVHLFLYSGVGDVEEMAL